MKWLLGECPEKLINHGLLIRGWHYYWLILFAQNIHGIFFFNIYILMNDSDLTATSLEWWLVKGNYRKLAELSDLWIIVIFPVSITLEGNFISLFSVCDPHFTWTNSNPKILMQYLISPDFGINLPNLSKSSNRIPQHRSIILPYEIAISRVPFLDAPNHTTG